jgi:hypothetical protein
LPALNAVLDNIEREGCERIVVVGDIINGIDPAGCLALLQSREDVTCLKGNAESYLVTPDLESFPERDDPGYSSLISLLQ